MNAKSYSNLLIIMLLAATTILPAESAEPTTTRQTLTPPRFLLRLWGSRTLLLMAVIDSQEIRNEIGLDEEKSRQIYREDAEEEEKTRTRSLGRSLEEDGLRFQGVIERVLSEDGRRRFREIVFQLEGPAALRREPLAKGPPLSNEQKATITQVQREFTERVRPLLGARIAGADSLNPRVPPLFRQAIIDAEAAEKQILAVLTPQQRRVWEGMLGRPLRLDWHLKPPSCSNDGTQFVAEASWSTDHSFLVKLDEHGKNVVPLTDPWSWNLAPRFSPDGKRIVFSSTRSGAFELWLMDSDGQNRKRLTHGTLIADQGASFSPDGSKLVFGTRKSGIYLMKTDGTGLRQLTTKGHQPVLSPSGKWIVYQSGECFWKMTTEGRNVYALPATGFDASFSPDGHKLVHVWSWSRKNTKELYGENDICLLDMESGRWYRLTFTGGAKRNPTFTADGKKISFWASDRDRGKPAIYRMATDGSGLELLIDLTSREK